MISYEPFDPASRDRCYEIYPQLLERAPVYRTESGYWVVSRFADVRKILGDDERYSARPVMDEAMALPTNIDPEANPELLQRLFAIVADLPVDAGELLGSRSIVAADPPGHTRLRRIVSRGFTPRRIGELRDSIRELVAHFLAGIDTDAEFDLVERLAVPLPVTVIADLFGVNPEHYPDVKAWSDDILSAAHSHIRGTMDAAAQILQAIKGFGDYFVPRIDRLRRAPGDDLISTLVRAEAEERLSTTEMLLFIITTVAAGNETTTNLIANTVQALYENPDQLDLLLGRPELIPKAVEESLRYRSPLAFNFRETLEPVEVAGTTIPKGATVIVNFAAANRDPRQFANPDRFDILRDYSHHLAFGTGAHYCLGAQLGRLEAEEALTALLSHLRSFRLADEPIELIPSLLIYGPQRLRLTSRE